MAAATAAGNLDQSITKRSRYLGIMGSQRCPAMLFVIEREPTQTVCEAIIEKNLALI